MILDLLGSITGQTEAGSPAPSTTVNPSASSINLGLKRAPTDADGTLTAARTAGDVGPGETLTFLFRSDDDPSGTGDAITFQLIASAAATLTTPTVLTQSMEFSKAQLATGTTFTLSIPAKVAVDLGPYIGANVLCANTNNTFDYSMYLVAGVDTAQTSN